MHEILNLMRCMLAGNTLRLLAKHAQGSTDTALISERIYKSEDARDFALSRHDITNERTRISEGTFKRCPEDHLSVATHVRFDDYCLNTLTSCMMQLCHILQRARSARQKFVSCV
jgi:hypothetical protein